MSAAPPPLVVLQGGMAPQPFRPQTIDGSPIPYGYEAWSTALAKRGDGVSPEPAEPSLERTPPPKHRGWLDIIAQRPIWVSGRGRTLDTNEELIELSCLSATGERIRTWISRADFGERASLVRLLAAAKFPIRTGNAAAIETYLDLALHEAAKALPEVLLAARTGPYEVQSRNGVEFGRAWGWLLGNRWIAPPGAATIQLDTRRKNQWTTGFAERGSLEDWLAKYREVRARGSIVRWLIAPVFASALLRFVGARTFTLHHWGRARSGKTAITRFSITAAGDPQSLMAHHNRSEKSYTEVFRYVTDVQVVYNELQAADKDRDFTTLIYTFGEEKGRARAGQAGGLMAEIEDWHAIIRMTGEEQIVGRGRLNMGGAGARTVEIGEALLEPADAKALNIWCNYGPHGHALPAFLRWLGPVLSDPSQLEQLCEIHKWMTEAIASRVGQAHDRANNLSVVALGQALSDHVLLGNDPFEAAHSAVEDAVEVGKVVAREEAAYQTVASRALQLFRDHYLSRRSDWLDLGSELDRNRLAAGGYRVLMGVLAGEEVWLVASEVAKLLSRNELPPGRVWADLASEGALVREQEGHTVRRKIGPTWHPVVAIRRDRF